MTAPHRWLGRNGHPGVIARAAQEFSVRFLNARSVMLCGVARPRQFDPVHVLDRSMQEFWEHGYRDTSVDDLVEATGVRPGSLYNAFQGGKRELFLGSLERYSQLVVPAKLGALEQPGASVAELRGYF